ncbi:MAG: aldo/keto reductase [Candidatus Hydrogenedentes bacterium]|nr:aldo/keto reductase [Candidatus Hydrogenedentota bacterium]
MTNLNRRTFMKTSVGAVAASLMYTGASQAEVKALTATTPRTLGKTGITTSLLGMGTGTRAWKKDSAQIRRGEDVFVGTIAHAYEQGLRYFDLADMYGSHQYMTKAMKKAAMKRDELTLLTKTVSKTAEAVQADVDLFLKELETDYLDIVLLHCMTKGDWDVTFAPCMEVLAKAKEQGKIRAVGVSCHNLDAMKTAAELDWVDVMLSRINPFGVRMDGTPEEVTAVLKTAHANGKGMLGMKILGEGKMADKIDESLAFVLGLGCIDVINVGFLAQSEVDDTVRRIAAVG